MWYMIDYDTEILRSDTYTVDGSWEFIVGWEKGSTFPSFESNILD